MVKTLSVPGVKTIDDIRAIAEKDGYEGIIGTMPLSMLPEQLRPLIAAMREGYEALKIMVAGDISPDTDDGLAVA